MINDVWKYFFLEEFEHFRTQAKSTSGREGKEKNGQIIATNQAINGSFAPKGTGLTNSYFNQPIDRRMVGSNPDFVVFSIQFYDYYLTYFPGCRVAE